MPLYHLTLLATARARPVATGQCFVTAHDEDAARAAAAQCLSGTANGRSPWSDRGVVRCRPVRALNRMPPPEGVVMVPDPFTFIGWRVIEIAGLAGTAAERRSRADAAWPVCD